MQKNFTESFNISTGQIDKENGRISKVCILNSISKNVRRYTSEALESIVKIGKQNPVKSFIDHSYNIPNSVTNLLGSFSNFKRETNSVYADLDLLKTSPGYALILDLAENHPSLSGFSINATGVFDEEPDTEGREVCTEIIALKSVDLVGEPATTSSVWESELSELDGLRKENETLRASLSSLTEKVESLRCVIRYQDKQIKEAVHSELQANSLKKPARMDNQDLEEQRRLFIEAVKRG